MPEHAAFWRRAGRAGLGLLAFLAVAAIAFFGISYRIYYSTAAADLPCRNCTGDAQAVRVNGFDLYYRAVGEDDGRPAIVVVHGGPGMSSQTFKRSLDFLADEYRVIYYDQRGSGNSQIKPDPSLYTIDQLVEELESLRSQVIGADRIILVGHSAGGALVQRYALAYREHVDRMILIGSIPANGGMRTSGFLLDALLAGMNVAAGNVPPASPTEADAEFLELSYTTSLPRLYDPGSAALIQDMGYVSFVTNREVTRSTFGGDFDETLRQLTINTLLVYGAADSPGTGEQGMTRLHDLLPNSTLVRFEHSGHWPFLEEPEEFRRVLRGFLAGGQ
jgi:proline iminopeptidase